MTVVVNPIGQPIGSTYYDVEAGEGSAPTNPEYPYGDSRRQGEDVAAEEVVGWFDFGDEPTYVNASAFTVPGDQTTRYRPKLRVRIIGGASTVYGRITSVAYVDPSTTIGVALDSGSVPNPSTSVALQIVATSKHGSSIVTDQDTEAYALIVGNNNNGSTALGRMIVGVGENGSGAFDSAVGIVAVPTAHGEFLPGSGFSGRQVVFNTGTNLTMIFAVADLVRIALMGDGNMILRDIQEFADDAAAEAGDVPVDGIYHNAGALRIRRT